MLLVNAAPFIGASCGAPIQKPTCDAFSMKTPTSNEVAITARICAITAAEQNRSNWWQVIDLHDREHALAIAGIPKARATDPLSSFTDRERANIRTAINVHLSRMELIARCFQARNTNVDGHPA